MKRRRKLTKGRVRFLQPWLLRDQAQINVWNQRFPIGTEVVYTMGDKKRVRTRTRSVAYKIHPHSPVLIDLSAREGVVLNRVIALSVIEKGQTKNEKITLSSQSGYAVA